jgi:hypothetical protein
LLPENSTSIGDIPPQFTEGKRLKFDYCLDFEYKFAEYIQEGRLVASKITALDIFM